MAAADDSVSARTRQRRCKQIPQTGILDAVHVVEVELAVGRPDSADAGEKPVPGTDLEGVVPRPLAGGGHGGEADLAAALGAEGQGRDRLLALRHGCKDRPGVEPAAEGQADARSRSAAPFDCPHEPPAQLFGQLPGGCFADVGRNPTPVPVAPFLYRPVAEVPGQAGCRRQTLDVFHPGTVSHEVADAEKGFQGQAVEDGTEPGQVQQGLGLRRPGEGVSAAGPAELAQSVAVGDEVDFPVPGVVHRGGVDTVEGGECGKGIVGLEQRVEERRAGRGLGAVAAFTIHPDGEIFGAEDLFLVRVGGDAGPPHPWEGKAGAGPVLFVVLECVPHLEQGGVSLLIAPAGGAR